MTEGRVHYGGGERPRYEALRHAIDVYYQDLLRPLLKLRAAVFGVLPLRDPRYKDAEEDEEGVSFTEAQLALVDQAVEIFLNEVAGEDRTREGFIAAGTDVDAANGIIQGRDLFLYSLGISRTSSQAAGISPIETGRQLTGQFDEYSGYEFQRLARTEAAFASEAGVRDQMWDLGVKKAEWLISADACPICEDLADGGPYDIDDEDNLPPAHPNCLCSTKAVGREIAPPLPAPYRSPPRQTLASLTSPRQNLTMTNLESAIGRPEVTNPHQSACLRHHLAQRRQIDVLRRQNEKDHRRAPALLHSRPLPGDAAPLHDDSALIQVTPI